MNNERDIIMNTQPYAEDLGIDPSEDGDEIKTGSKTIIDALPMIRWLNAEIEFLDGVPHALNRQAAFRDCKKQLLKLLDGMGVE